MTDMPAAPALDLPPCPRTLILDFRDSYTANLLTLFSTIYPPLNSVLHSVGVKEDHIVAGQGSECIAHKVVIVQADTLDLPTYLDLLKEKEIDCVILSPGPGRADREEDVPNLMQIIDKTEIPILGVCLGMQAIAVYNGAKIVNTPDLKHGHVIPVKHNRTSIFDCIPRGGPSEESQSEELQSKDERRTETVDVVAYNSLTVSWQGFPHDKLRVTAWHEVSQSRDDIEDAWRTIQAIEGIGRPIWGVQFHPESIASSHGADILRSFLRKTHAFHGNPPRFPTLSQRVLEPSPVNHGLDVNEPSRPIPHLQDDTIEHEDGAMLQSVSETFESSSMRSDVDAEEMFMHLLERVESPLGHVWLDGVSSRAPTTSSIAFPSFVLTYSVSSRTITCHHIPASNDGSETVVKTSMQLPATNEDDFWNWFGRGHTALKRMNLTQGQRWKTRQPSVYHASAEEEDRKPRWTGGWVGWWGYEMKAESLGGYARPPKSLSHDDEHVDACWAWCNSLVQREQNGTWTARGILEVESIPSSISAPDLPPSEMLSWLSQLGVPFGTTRQQWKSWTDTCQSVLSQPAPVPYAAETSKMPHFVSDMSAEEYMEGIQKCRQAIFAGDSYELTMTTPFRASVNQESASRPSSQAPSRAPEAIKLYLQLRRQNPAPYSTYLSLPTVDSTIISSSPERFLRVTPGGRIEMKPIKGTRARVRYPRDLKLAAEALGEGITDIDARRWCEEKDRQIGESLRNDGKERAENLMIVDLIRSDLQSCCASHSVQVPKLIALETYETVHQLVTTVRGQLLDGIGEVEAVKRSFPPGSMTGAPKLRSVQLLEDFELQQPRGIYSGAMGYMSIDGAVDLSVVIRTIVIEKTRARSTAYGPETANIEAPAGRSMTIGAGGAITWLSDPRNEWEEVMTKVRSVVG